MVSLVSFSSLECVTPTSTVDTNERLHTTIQRCWDSAIEFLTSPLHDTPDQVLSYLLSAQNQHFFGWLESVACHFSCIRTVCTVTSLRSSCRRLGRNVLKQANALFLGA